MVDMSGGGDGPLGSIVVEVSANISKLISGFGRAKGEASGFERDMAKVTRTTNLTAAAEMKLDGELRSLARAYDPVHAAALRYQTDLQRISRLEKAGIADGIAAARLRAGATKQYNEVRNPPKGPNGPGGLMGGVVGLGKGFVGGLIGAVSIETGKALYEMAQRSIEAAAAIGDVAKAVGLTTTQLQEYRGMATSVGLTTAQIDEAFGQFGQTVARASAGAVRESKLFDLLGISLKDAAGNARPLNDVFLEFADKMGHVGDEGQRTAALMMAFGEDLGPKMKALLEQGSSGIKNLADGVEHTGQVLSSEEIQKARETAEKLRAVKDQLNADVSHTVIDNAHAIEALATAFARLAGEAAAGIGYVISFLEAAQRGPGLIKAFMTGGPEALREKVRENKVEAGQVPNAVVGSTVHLGDPKSRSGGMVQYALPTAKPVGWKPPAAKPAAPAGGNIDLSKLLAPKGPKPPKTPKGPKGRQAPINENDREELREREEHLRLMREGSSNLVEINGIDRQLIDINLQQRETQLDEMVKRKTLTAAQAKKLKGEAEDNALLEKELADRKMREDLINQRAATASEFNDLAQSMLETELRMARTDEARQRIEASILSLKQKQELAEIDKAIALARENKDLDRIADLTAERAQIVERQGREVQAFAVEHLRGIEKFKNDLPQTVAEINEAIDNIRFDHFTAKLQQMAEFAGDVGSAFGKAAGDIASFKNPMDVLRGLVGDLAQTFTKNFIEKPVTEWATRHIGNPLAKQAFGKELTSGPDALTVQQMNVALGTATMDLGMLARAAQAAAFSLNSVQGGGFDSSGFGDGSSMFDFGSSFGGTDFGGSTAFEAPGAGFGDSGSLDFSMALGDLSGDVTKVSSAFQALDPQLGQFGNGLLNVLSGLAGGGGGGGGGDLMGLLKMGLAIGGAAMGGGGFSGAGMDFGMGNILGSMGGPSLGAIGAFDAAGMDFGPSALFGGLGMATFAEGGWTGGKGGPKEDKNIVRTSPKEFIVHTEPAAQFGPLLERINSGAIPDMGALSDALGASRTPASGDSYNFGGIHIHGARDERSARSSGRQAGAEINKKIREANRAGVMR